MEQELRPETTFLEELKRRKVVRAALVYAAGAFAVLEVADIHRATGRDLRAREARARFNRLWAGADGALRTEVLARYGADLP